MAKSSSKSKKTISSQKFSAGSEMPDTKTKKSPEESKEGLEDLFLDSIKDIYWAENHLVKAIPKMRKAASSGQLQNAFADHLEVTKEHVKRLVKVFELLGEKAQAKKCDAMEGLSIEGEGIIEDTDAGTPARDVGLILAAQKVEHYEIATYGGLAQLAKTLGQDEIAALLAQTLSEEKEADALLTQIAENDISYEGVQQKQQ